MSSTAAGVGQQQQKQEHPSVSTVDETGERWRSCAGAAVLNSRGELLVGERAEIPGAWQCPQGGVDDGETLEQASVRELYEETGLVLDRDVIVDPDLSSSSSSSSTTTTPVRYSTGDDPSKKPQNWLSKAGFAGQELSWTVFRCVRPTLDVDPAAACELDGKGGEDREFSRVEWRSVEDAVQGIWERKRAPYDALKRILATSRESWRERSVDSLDLEGLWTRESCCDGTKRALVARGLSEARAEEELSKPYVQRWTRDKEDPSNWTVTTYAVDGTTPRRKLSYRVGEWEERYEGSAVIFGPSDDGGSTLKRRTSYLAEPDADSKVAHVTVTRRHGPQGGTEESRRYLKGAKMILRRTLFPAGEESSMESALVSTEVFVRK